MVHSTQDLCPPETERSQRRVVICVLAAILVGTVCAAGFLGSKDGGLRQRDELLQGGGGTDYKTWYQEQSADSWFGGGTFQGKDVQGRKKEKSKWIGKEALALIPKVERAHADRKLKARMVQLVMTDMMAKDSYQHKKKALEQELEAKPFVFKPTLVPGTMSESEVSAVVHNLVLQYMNRTALVNITAEKSGVLNPSTPEEEERKRKELKAKDEAEKKLDHDLEMASPKLKDEYELEVQAHKTQNEKMDAVANLIKSMTSSAGYVHADISQCGDHCDEVVQAKAHQAQEAEKAHESQEAEEAKELKQAVRRRV